MTRPIYTGRHHVAEAREVHRQRVREAQLARRRTVLVRCLALAGLALLFWIAATAAHNMATASVALIIGGF